MNNEEKDLIANFFARVSGQQQAGTSGSVPATLPPIDSEANRFIQENIQKYPESAYRITQMAVVQEAALVEAQNRIRQLQWELQQARQSAQQAANPQPSGQPAGGFFKNLFGGSSAPAPSAPPSAPPGWGQQAGPAQQGYAPPPQSAYPPGYQPGMFQRQGSGFLGSALSTAAGVAGGMMVGNALTSLLSHHGSSADTGGFAGDFGGAAGDNTFGAPAASDPFAGAGTSVDPGFDAGADTGGGFDDSGFDSGGWGDDSF